MIKINKLSIILTLSFFLLSPVLLGMEVKVKERGFFNQGFPFVTVPGKMVFQSNREGALSEIWILENGQIKKIASGKNTDKNIPKQLSGPPAGMFGGAFADLREPKWSPDGKTILCLNGKELILINEDGSNPKAIDPSKYPHLAVWAPNGSAIYYVAIDNHPNGGGSQNIYRLNLSDKSEQKITDLAPLPGIRRILSIAVSPDDKIIAFAMVGEDEYGISIWTVNTDGSDLRLLVKYADDPAWSPDGSKLAYVSSYDANGKKVHRYDKIFILDLKTMQTIQLTTKGWTDRRPVFSPDGTKIAFESYRHREIAHGSELFVIDIDGTGEARITPPQKNPKYPNDLYRGWSTDQYPDWRA